LLVAPAWAQDTVEPRLYKLSFAMHATAVTADILSGRGGVEIAPGPWRGQVIGTRVQLQQAAVSGAIIGALWWLGRGDNPQPRKWIRWVNFAFTGTHAGAAISNMRQR
jgi:hypothetical protein